MRYALVVLVIVLFASTASGGPIFVFNPTGDAQADAGFAAAGALWSNLFTDNVTINITIGFAPLAGSIIGQASSVQDNYTYGNTTAAMLADATSADDTTATGNLQPGGDQDFWINRTANSPNGAGDPTPYLDNDGDLNNSSIRMTNANAKALGLLAANQGLNDASITFNSNFSFDFDPTDGITAGAFDFIGVAAHEIGHALGFISGVDVLDTNSPPGAGPFLDNQFDHVSVLDLFRYSVLGQDWTADTRSKYFSIDGGTTSLATFSTGRTFGDGQQASHWKDNLGIGLMDPTAARGELLSISGLDITAFDVIGWNLNLGGAVVPLPAPVWMGLGMLASLGAARIARRRRMS